MSNKTFEAAQDKTTSTTETYSTEKTGNSTTESASTTSKQPGAESEELDANSKTEDAEDDKTVVKKEEKRPASNSPVSDLLNGIYRLISVSDISLITLKP